MERAGWQAAVWTVVPPDYASSNRQRQHLGLSKHTFTSICSMPQHAAELRPRRSASSGRSVSDAHIVRSAQGKMDRSRIIRRAGWTGIGVNLTLTAAKAAVGAAASSVAMTSDALNNLTDAMSAIITLIGAKAADKHPDREHPFGHGRWEYVSSAAIAVLILYAGVTVFIESVTRIASPAETHYDTLSVLVMGGSVGVKLGLSVYCRHTGARIDSPALRATGVDAALDAAMSAAILTGIVIRLTTGAVLDGWLGIGVAFVILKSGADVLKEGLSSIIGEQVPAELTNRLCTAIAQFPGVQGVCDLQLHRYGPERVIGSVYVVLPEDMTVGEADGICRRISESVAKDESIELAVAIYATNYAAPGADEIHAALHKLASGDPEILQVHGFRADLANRTVNFHIVIDYSNKNPSGVRDRLTDCMKRQFPNYTFYATTDFGTSE